MGEKHKDGQGMWHAREIKILTWFWDQSLQQTGFKTWTYHYHDHHHHLALQPYVSLGLLCYSPPLVSILSFPSPSFNPHLS
jgi:hypothetical protein